MDAKNARKAMDKTYWKTLSLAIGVTVVCTILGCMLLSTLLISGATDIKRLDTGVAIVLFTAAITASLFLKERGGEGTRSVIIIYLAIVVGVLLLLNLMIVGGEFNRVTMKIGAVALGGAAMMFGSGRKNKKRKRR